MLHQAGMFHKVVMLGNSGVGKTTVLQALIHPTEDPTKTQATIGCYSNDMVFKVDGQDVHLTIWDTAGQEIFQSIVPIYIRDAMACILVFDVTDIQSLHSLDNWLSILKEENPEKIPLYVVGNKTDLPETVSLETQKSFAQSIGATPFRISAARRVGVEDLFQYVAKEVASRTEAHSTPSAPVENPGGKKKCC